MNDKSYRQRFTTLFLQIAGEIGASGNFGPQLEQAQSLSEICLELRRKSMRLRFMHSSQEAYKSRALIEISAGVAPDAQKASLYASMLVLNGQAWPAAYCLDPNIEEVACSWPVALEGAVAANIGRAIESALERFDAWAEMGMLMPAMKQGPLHVAVAPYLPPANLILEEIHG